MASLFNFKRTGRANAVKAAQGGAGFDNPRENIDPFIKTKVISTKEILSGAKVLGDFFDEVLKQWKKRVLCLFQHHFLGFYGQS